MNAHANISEAEVVKSDTDERAEIPAKETEVLPETMVMPAPPAEAPTPDPDRFALRAKQPEITLTDTRDRSLSGELLATTEKHLKLRRQSDGRIVEVPVSMLAQEDQAFAAYLFSEKASSRAPKSTTDADMIWDELFKGM